MPDWFTFKGDLGKLQKQLTAIERKQLPYAMRRAVNAIAKDAQAAYKAEVAKVFDRPTPFTVNATAIMFAGKGSPSATLFIRNFAGKGRNPAQTWLRPEVQGGARDTKRAEQRLQRMGVLRSGEYLVPAKDAPLDQYGNLARGIWTKLLSDLNALGDVSGNRNRRRHGAAVFFIPKGVKFRAICMRRGRDIVPILMIVNRAPRYQRRLDWDGLMRKAWASNYEKRLSEAMAFALSTARQ